MSSLFIANHPNRIRFIILTSIVLIAGISQGLLLPLLSVLLEQRGVTSGANGMNAAALYVGVFLTVFFVEKPVGKYGYKPVIASGLLIVLISSLLFPLSGNLTYWFILRFLVGVGDSALHYATQLWVVSDSTKENRGQAISLYGMAYGVGFALGPLGINLLQFGMWIPFLALAIICLVAYFLLVGIKNAKPEAYQGKKDVETGRAEKFSKVARLAWFALLPPYLYGFMEASMNGNFPIYGLWRGFSEGQVSLLLPMIGVGGLILQLPLGIWSDRMGRKPILIGCGLIGGLAMLAIPFSGTNVPVLVTLLLLAGGLVGSFYTLGLAYAADMLPRSLLPTANVIASVNFSIGSILGPIVGGYGMQYVTPGFLFFLLGGFFLLFSVVGFKFRPQVKL